MKQKSICFLKSGIQNQGGLEKYTLHLADFFAKSGHKVTLLTTDYKETSSTPYKVVNLGKRSKLTLWHLYNFDRKCKKYLEEHPQDVVFGMDRNFCTQTHYRAGNGVHRAYIERRKEQESFFKRISFEINPLHKLILAMEKRTFESENLKRLFTNSHMVQEELLRYYNVSPEKIAVVHNGVEWHELERPFEEGLQIRPQLQKQLGLHPEHYQFLFVGNDYGRKGLKLLLQALAMLEDKDFELAVVGRERNPEMYVLMAKELGLQDRVRFFGPIKEMKTLYSAADSLVIPSMYDPFANVTVEALAMGVYVISSSANGGSEVLTNDLLGLTFHSLQDPQELAACLKKAMQKPKTAVQAKMIRQAVCNLDFAFQIQKIAELI